MVWELVQSRNFVIALLITKIAIFHGATRKIEDKSIIPECLLDFIKSGNAAALSEQTVASWLNRVALGKIPMEDLVRVQAGKVVERFCEVAAKEPLLCSLCLVAKCALKKLVKVSYDSAFCGEGVGRQRNLKVELIIRRPQEFEQEKSKIVKTQNKMKARKKSRLQIVKAEANSKISVKAQCSHKMPIKKEVTFPE